jgi:hypothetical protein
VCRAMASKMRSIARRDHGLRRAWKEFDLFRSIGVLGQMTVKQGYTRKLTELQESHVFGNRNHSLQN